MSNRLARAHSQEKDYDSPAVTKNDVATASGPGIAGFSVNGKWKNPQIRSPKEPSMIRKIQREGHKLTRFESDDGAVVVTSVY